MMNERVIATLGQLSEHIKLIDPYTETIEDLDENGDPTGETLTVRVIRIELEYEYSVYSSSMLINLTTMSEIVAVVQRFLATHLMYDVYRVVNGRSPTADESSFLRRDRLTEARRDIRDTLGIQEERGQEATE